MEQHSPSMSWMASRHKTESKRQGRLQTRVLRDKLGRGWSCPDQGGRVSRGERAHGSESAQMSYGFGMQEDQGDGERARTSMAGDSGWLTTSARAGGQSPSHHDITMRAWARAGRDARPWAVVATGKRALPFKFFPKFQK
jgi:hypothetical protein